MFRLRHVQYKLTMNLSRLFRVEGQRRCPEMHAQITSTSVNTRRILLLCLSVHVLSPPEWSHIAFSSIVMLSSGRQHVSQSGATVDSEALDRCRRTERPAGVFLSAILNNSEFKGQPETQLSHGSLCKPIIFKGNRLFCAQQKSAKP